MKMNIQGLQNKKTGYGKYCKLIFVYQVSIRILKMILKTYFIIALYFTGGHVIDTKLGLHHYSDKDYEEIFYLKNNASISKNCLRHSENEDIKKMIRSKYDGKKIYKVTKNEEKDSSQETLEEEITS